MKKRLFHLFQDKILSPWWIFSVDILLSSFAFVLAYVIRLNFRLPSITAAELMIAGACNMGIYILSFLVFRTYRGVIRHTELGELIRLLYSNIAAMGLLFALDFINKWLNGGVIHVPRLVIVLHFIFTLFLLTGFRMLVRKVFAFLSSSKDMKQTLIYGAGDLGLLALEILNKERKEKYKVVGFIDDELSKHNKLLRDLRIYSFDKAIAFGQKKGVTVLVLAIANLAKEKVREITEICLEMNWGIKVLPAFDDWIEGTVAEKNVRSVKIEDLLGRDQIQLDLDRIRKGLEGKTILVSGAAGSIGSEIVRQLLKFPVGKLILLDQAESALYDLQQEILAEYDDAPYELVISDISNFSRMRKTFSTYQPQIVFNAAAYKHVPLMEDNPYEALNVNVGGTRNLADLSVKYGVEKFVMVSTDKAVNPTNVMGASKRICEIYIQALAQCDHIKTSFITTRFGHVLGSNGSVVPLFKRQMEKGAPITVTHPEITRYFMTIPEACQLVLEAGFMGQGGEIFVFDMGKPVKIVDLAKKMIRLSGLQLDADIQIKYTGLRPGEKLYEELLATTENTLSTHNDRIMIGQVCVQDFEKVSKAVGEMLQNLNEEENELLVSRMKDLVPEFISQNSEFASLDAITK